jgi:hypothetical protein
MVPIILNMSFLSVRRVTFQNVKLMFVLLLANVIIHLGTFLIGILSFFLFFNESHLYPGGAWRIHMLRKLVGEEAFWGGVKEYVATNMHKLVETGNAQG